MCSKSAKRICASVMAFATAVTTLTAFPETKSAVSAEDVKYEFEDGTIEGSSTTVMTTEKGYSGTGYVYLKDANDTISVDVEVPSAGMYDIIICYNLPTDSGSKTQNIYINGDNQGQIVFSPNDKFSEKSIGNFKLKEGKNTIKIEASWGWTMFDYLTVKSAVLPEFSASANLCDAKAADSAKRLMSYLADTYGTAIISGQQEFYGVSRDDEFNYIKELSGKLPAIRGFDFGETCPLYAWDAGTAERAIDWTKNGGIATASWHINVPAKMSEYTLGETMDFQSTTYTEKTDFVTANVMKEGTVEHDYFLLAVKNLADSLTKLQDADVPLIFRPFHEAEGNGGADGSGAWFWWAKEGAETYKELYKYLYNILTEEYGLHNLIWEFNSYVYDSSYEWYPGADYVDIIGYDKYNAHNWSTGQTAPNESAISGVFYSLVNMYGKDMKPIAMAENDTIPSVENLTEEKAGWLYFCPWYGEHLMDTNYNTKESLAAIYKSDYVITLDELPDLKTYPIGGGEPVVTEPPVTETTEPTESSTTETSAETVTHNAVILEKSDKTLTVAIEDFDSDKTVITIPDDQLDYVMNGLEVGDRIIIGFADETAKKVLWVDLLEKGETTESSESEQNTEAVILGRVLEIGDTTIKIDSQTTDEEIVMNIPSEQIDYVKQNIETGDLIEAGINNDDKENPVWIKLNQKLQVTETQPTESTETTDNPTTNDTPVSPTILGDATCDGAIDVRDVSLISQYLVKLKKLDEQAIANADVDKDGEVKINDLAQIKRYLIKDISKL